MEMDGVNFLEILSFVGGKLRLISLRKRMRDYKHDLLKYFVLFAFFILAGTLKAKTDSSSFLFSLVNPSGSEPVKLNPKSGGGIRCTPRSGPIFGTSVGYDLETWNSDFIGCPSYLDLGYGFERPESVNKNKFFFGSSPFDIDELEVFKVNF